MEYDHYSVAAKDNPGRQEGGKRAWSEQRDNWSRAPDRVAIATGEVAASFGYCWMTFALAIAFLAASFVLASKFFNKTVVAMMTTTTVAKAAI
jgi:hypothetical protein